MDDLLGTLFYILISVALIIFSALKKNKKEGTQGNTNPNNTASASSKESASTSFWDEMLGIDDGNAQQKATAEASYEEEREFEEEAPVVYKKQEAANNATLTKKEPKPYQTESPSPRKQKPYNIDVAAELRRKRELRKAIIYSEIIKPKHF